MNFFKFHFFFKSFLKDTKYNRHGVSQNKNIFHDKIICLKNVCVPFKQLWVFKEGAITILMDSLIMKNGVFFFMNFWNCPKENDKI